MTSGWEGRVRGRVRGRGRGCHFCARRAPKRQRASAGATGLTQSLANAPPVGAVPEQAATACALPEAVGEGEAARRDAALGLFLRQLAQLAPAAHAARLAQR